MKKLNGFAPDGRVLMAKDRRRFDAAGDIPVGMKLIVGCASGIVIIDTTTGNLHRLANGKFYGMTPLGDCWLFAWSNGHGAQKSDRTSTIYSGKIIENELVSLEPVIMGIPNEIHQIDVFEDKLWIPHTGYNQILSINVADLDAKQPRWIWDLRIRTLPLRSPSHLNSIYFHRPQDLLYLVAHNQTRHTGVTSEIVICNRKFRVMEVIDTSGHSVHNVCVLKEGYMYCDSGNRRLMCNDREVFSSQKLLRGMSVTEECIVVGGSDICYERNERFSNDSSVFFLNRDGELLGEIGLPGLGDIYEIRQLESTDLALSEHKESKANIAVSSRVSHVVA